MYEYIPDWLSDENFGHAVKTLSVLLGIVASLYGATKLLAPWMKKFTKCALTRANRYLVQSRSCLSCFSLRMAIIYRGPDEVLNAAFLLSHEEHAPDIAFALAVLGHEKQAGKLHAGNAAYGVASVKGITAALKFIKALDDYRAVVGVFHDSLKTISRDIKEGPDENGWRRDLALKSPLVSIADGFCKRSVRWGEHLTDIEDYIKSEPNVPIGPDKIRDKGLLKPIDARRLKRLRQVVVTNSSCKNLPKFAANLAALSHAVETHSSQNSTNKTQPE